VGTCVFDELGHLNQSGTKFSPQLYQVLYFMPRLHRRVGGVASAMTVQGNKAGKKNIEKPISNISENRLK
jgi:hypothetical protein